jgi:hypothetical protein
MIFTRQNLMTHYVRKKQKLLQTGRPNMDALIEFTVLLRFISVIVSSICVSSSSFEPSN